MQVSLRERYFDAITCERFVDIAKQFMKHAATIDRPAPRVGEHTFAILRESGFTAQEIEEMLDRRSIAQLDEPR